MGEFFSQYREEGKEALRIGSVKTNIGHLESAAGVAGIVKVLLMMKHGKTVRSLHFERPNPKIDFPKYNMAVSIAVEDWPTLNDGTRMSCVNSFGFGGTNSHAIIKQFPLEDVQETDDDTKDKYIVFLSALDNGGLTNSLQHFINCLKDTCVDSLKSIAYTSSCRREHFKYRLAFVCESKEDLRQKAEVQLKTIESVRPAGLNPPNVVFVFCGVGTTWTGMCQELLQSEAVFSETVRKVDELLKPYTKWSIYEKLKDAADLSEPLVGHLAIFTCQIGLTELWKYYGIVPKVVLGQSVGEVAAAYAAGCLSLEDAVKVIYHRSSILSKATGGSMFVVGSSKTEMVDELCQEYDGKINIAVYNSSKSSTVSGDTDIVNEVMQKLKKKSEEEDEPIFLRPLHVKCAYHSHHTEKSSIDLENALNGLTGVTPTTKLFSTVTGEVATDEQFVTASYWRENVRKPVLFQKAVRNAGLLNTINIFVEIGPKPVLRTHLSDSFAEGKAISLPSMNVNSESSCIMDSLAEFYKNGVNPEMERINPYTAVISDIPKYIPNRMKSLFEADSTKLRKQGRGRLASAHPFVKRQSDDNTPFKIDISTTSTPYVYEHNVAGNILVPGALYAEVAIEASKSLLEQSPFNLEIGVDFQRPLRLSPGSPCEAFVMLKSLEPLESMTFTIQTGNDIIARGTSRIIKEDVKVNFVDIQKIKERCKIFHPKDQTYETLKTLGFSYGDDLQILGDGYKNRTECLVNVTLSDLLIKDLNTTNIHPAILDGLLQTPGIIFELMEERPSGQLLPAGFKKLILRRSPEKNMLAYMNLTSFSKDEILYNLLLLQPDGIVVAEVKDFTIRAIEKSERHNGQIAHKIVWTEVDLQEDNKKTHGLTQLQDKDAPSDEESDKSSFTCKADLELLKDDYDKQSNSSGYSSEKKDKDKDGCSSLSSNEKKDMDKEFSSSEDEEKDVKKDEISNPQKQRRFIFISRDERTKQTFKDSVYGDLEISYYIANNSTNIIEDILEEHFKPSEAESVKDDKETCIIFANGRMKEEYTVDGTVLLDDLVNNCDLLLTILKFMADRQDSVPIYILTQSTQSPDVSGQFNLVGSELWGLVRSVLREQSFKLYLVDIDPSFKECMKQLLTVLKGNNKRLEIPEIAIRKKKIYENEFVTQPDSERIKTPKVKSIDKYCVAEYRSNLPDVLNDTFYSLQEMDGDMFDQSVLLQVSKACIHNNSLYPLTFENAVEAVTIWPQDHKDGYGVLTFEVVGKRIDKKDKKDKSMKEFVACYPLKIQSVVNIPKSCMVCLTDLQPYVPGMLCTTSLLWELVSKLPSKKNYLILTDNENEMSAIILKNLIASRKSGPAMVFKLEEIMSPDQISPIVIPLMKIDLQTIHGFLEVAKHVTMIASLRQFLPLQIERYVAARSSHIQFVTVDVDEVLSKTKLPQIVPTVINWLKKQKHKLLAKDQIRLEPSDTTLLPFPSNVVDVTGSSDAQMCDIRIPENLIFRKTAVYVIIGGMTGLGWEITNMLAERGAGFIVSLSRREPSNEKQTKIKEMSDRYECFITTMQTDITSIESLQESFDRILSEAPYPIKGIFQGAGVLDDALFISMTREKLQKVLMPKVLGTWNLHIVSEKLSLDYFVIHSSMTSVFGNAGQTNYGAANAFLDSLAHYRRHLGLCGQSINWGPLKVGMAINDDSLEQILEKRGLLSLSIPTIRKSLIEVLKNTCPQVTYGVFDWDVIASGLISEDMSLVQYRFRGFVDKILEQRRSKMNSASLNFDLNEIMSIPRAERMEAIMKALFILASDVFGVEHSLLNEDTLISALGVDSMLAMTFAQTVLKVMHVKISLVMLLTDGTTMMALAEAINDKLENGNAEEEIKIREIDTNVANSMTPYEKRAYNGHMRNKYDPSLYMFGDITVDSVIAMPEYWKPLIVKIHQKYPALRTLFIPGHDDIRYGVKRVILEPEEIEIDFRIVEKSLLLHKTRHPSNVDDYLFDPATDLPMRVFFAKKGRQAIMRFLFNHLALDLHSISMMMNDLRPDAPNEDPTDPVDIALHIERRLIDDDVELRTFWQTVIPENLQPMSLSVTGDLTTDPNFFEFTRLRVPEKVATGIRPLLEGNKCTLFHLFATMFEILLHVELRQPTIAIMTTLDCRMFFPELKREANRFTNRIPLYQEFEDSSIQVAEIIQRNKIKIMKALDHGYMPFIDIIQDVKGHPVNEIFRHQIVMEETTKISSLAIDHGKRTPIKIKKLQVGNYYNETIFYVWNDETTKKLELELGCSTLIIDQDRAHNLLNFMLMMIERFVANPGITLEEMTSYNVASCKTGISTSEKNISSEYWLFFYTPNDFVSLVKNINMKR